MKLIRDDTVIDSLVAAVMELQNRESTSLPLYEKQLRETETGIQNMLNAIQAGILTSSTKERLEALEAQKKDLEAKIAEEKLAKPVMKKVRKPFLSARPPRLRQRKKVRIWIALVHHGDHSLWPPFLLCPPVLHGLHGFYSRMVWPLLEQNMGV